MVFMYILPTSLSVLPKPTILNPGVYIWACPSRIVGRSTGNRVQGTEKHRDIKGDHCLLT